MAFGALDAGFQVQVLVMGDATYAMKDKVAANRLAGSMDLLVAQARRFFRELAPHPVSLPEAA